MKTERKELIKQVRLSVKQSAATFRDLVVEGIKAVSGTDDDIAKHLYLTGLDASPPGLIGSDLGLRNRIVGELIRGLPALLTGSDCCFFRIGDRRVDTSELQGSVDWKGMGPSRSAAKKFGPNCVAFTQLTPFTNFVHDDGGWLIEAETRGIVWGENIRGISEKIVSKLQPKFQRRQGSGQPIQLDWFAPDDDQLIVQIASMLSIMLDFRFPTTPIDALRFAHVLAPCPIEKLIFGNGWGKGLLDGIVADQKRRIGLRQKDAVMPLHPDEAFRYIASFAKRCPDYPYDMLPIMWMR